MTFYSADGYYVIDSILADKDEVITVPVLKDPSEMVKFKGWATTANAEAATVTDEYTVTADANLYAVFGE